MDLRETQYNRTKMMINPKTIAFIKFWTQVRIRSVIPRKKLPSPIEKISLG
jgi:hypothetical protein